MTLLESMNKNGKWKKNGRLLLRVARFRYAELTAGLGYGDRGWMPAAQRLLTQHGIDDAWTNTTVAADTPVNAWNLRTTCTRQSKSRPMRVFRDV